jgi:hypothetical protein
MQIDNTLGLLDDQFTVLKQEELDKVGFIIKLKKILKTKNLF